MNRPQDPSRPERQMLNFKPTVLVIDDETEMGRYLSLVAEETGYDSTAIDNSSLFESVYSRNCSMIILDMFMPGRDGVEILRFLAEDRYRGHIVLVSGFDAGVLHSAIELAEAHGLKILGALSKPILYADIEDLLLKGIRDLPSDDPSLAGEIILPTRSDLVRGLEKGEIQPYFQPQIDIPSGRLLGVEALVRWKHPTLGLQTPDIIIPMVEKFNLMDEMTFQILEKALEWVQLWKNAGLNLRASVNISASTIIDLALPELLGDYLRARDLDSDHLVLEVTEQSLISQLSTSLDILTRIRMKNIRLSIDDFGTGHSSLVQLYRAPFSEVKIDRSFVSKATTQNEARAIVEMTITLAHKLNMTTVGEGVEDEQTLALLRSLGCDIAQGFYFSRPMPGAELLGWERQRQKGWPGLAV
jgi:EAL domain-containing protein (putative c-di-GMP-specific phosphodiesterase class I)/ActR/RegA family two-component response regulator